MHPPKKVEHHDEKSLGLGANSHNRAPVPPNNELRFICDNTEEAKNGLLNAREMAESTRDRAPAATEAAKRTRQEQ